MFYVIIASYPKDPEQIARFNNRCIDYTEFDTRYRGQQVLTSRVYYGYKTLDAAARARDFIKMRNAGRRHGVRLCIYKMSQEPNPENLHLAHRA